MPNPAFKNTTFAERVQSFLGVLCGEQPPLEMVEGWLYAPDDERLQEWVLSGKLPDALAWAQGIGVIDAARVAAEQPEETRGDATLPQHEDFATGKVAFRNRMKKKG